MPVDRQGLSSDNMVTPTDMNATTPLQKRNGVFYMAYAEML
jgi:hypothetical protein